MVISKLKLNIWRAQCNCCCHNLFHFGNRKNAFSLHTKELLFHSRMQEDSCKLAAYFPQVNMPFKVLLGCQDAWFICCFKELGEYMFKMPIENAASRFTEGDLWTHSMEPSSDVHNNCQRRQCKPSNISSHLQLGGVIDSKFPNFTLLMSMSQKFQPCITFFSEN